MADEQERARTVRQGLLKALDGRKIHVVRRFVHDDEMRAAVDAESKQDLADFARAGLFAFQQTARPRTEFADACHDASKLVFRKTRDIRKNVARFGGGNLLIRVYNSLPDEQIDKESDVTVHTDGRTYQVKAGTQIRLTPGESISIQPRMYHDFEVEEGTGAVLLGEVSQVNDDNADNRFNPPVGRFPEIEEDEPPYRLLCNEYPKAQ